MYCKNCGKEISDNSVRCPWCGVEVNSNSFNIGSGFNNQGFNLGSNFSNNGGSYNKYSELKRYYQEEFSKFDNSGGRYSGKFNWCAFFFGSIWALTKGLWLLPIVCIASQVILDYWIVSIAWWLFWGFCGNKLYYNKYVYGKQIKF